MKKMFRATIFTSFLFFALTSEKNVTIFQGEYVCLPCGADCDTIHHNSPGTCSHCNMTLVKSSTIHHSNITPQDLCGFIARHGSTNVLLLDVRTVAEFEGRAQEKYGRLNNAINIPIQELETRMKELSSWKDKQIVVYCSHSHRSPRASYLLSQNGYKNVTNMLGGMSVWQQSVKDKRCDQKLYISQ